MPFSDARVRVLMLGAVGLAAAAFLAGPRAAAAQAGGPPRATSTDLQINDLPSGQTIDLIHGEGLRWVRVDTVASPRDSVWFALPGAYRDVGIEDVGQAADVWTMGKGRFLVRRSLGGERLSEYIDCGSSLRGPMANRAEIHLSVLTQLIPVDSARTAVLTSVFALATPRAVSGNAVHCDTEGKLESRIVGGLRKRLGG